MKILITGGAGYIGASLARDLSHSQNVSKIIVFDNLASNRYGLFSNQEANGEKIEFVKATILDNYNLANALKGVDVVYHLAAKVVSPDSDNDSQYFEQINNWGTANVVREAIKANVKHFVYLSSVYVYGQGPEVKTIEDDALPNSFYGISKLRGEEHLTTLPSNIKQHIIRSGSVYGANSSTRYDVLINQFLFESHFFNKLAIHGEGNQIRPFIHINKLSESLSKLPFSELPSGKYNLVEHNTSVMDIVESLNEIYPDLEYNHVNRHIRMKDVIVQPSPEIEQYIPYQPKQFIEEIAEFKKQLW